MAAASCGGHLCMQMWTSDVPGSEDWTPRAELMSLLEPNDITILILESDHHLLQNDRVHLMRQPYMMLTKLLACLHRQERNAFAFVDPLNREKVSVCTCTRSFEHRSRRQLSTQEDNPQSQLLCSSEQGPQHGSPTLACIGNIARSQDTSRVGKSDRTLCSTGNILHDDT